MKLQSLHLRRPTLWVSIVLLATLTFGHVAPSEGKSKYQARFSCGPVATFSGKQGLTLGAVRLPLSRPAVRSHQALIPYQEGTVTKVLLLPTKVPARGITIRGWRCLDGRSLRFAYQGEVLPRPPLTVDQLERLGTSPAHLPDCLYRSCGFTGYMLFTGLGKWKLSVSQGRREVAEAVVRVVPQAEP